MSSGITALGVKAAEAALAPARLIALMQQLLPRVLFTVESETKTTTPVKTGALRSSVAGEVQSVGRGAVGSNLVYAPIVHRRNPYLDRGVAAASGTIDALLAATGLSWSAS
jgi:hypothetical protein